MSSELWVTLRVTAVTLLLTGVAYPLVATGLAQVLFPRAANGSWVSDESGRVVGSELLGQGFSEATYFHPRPSAAGKDGWDATSSGGSNLGPTSQKLRQGASEALARLLAENPTARGMPPVELVSASGSGLDPHLSPAAVLWQVPRVARARNVGEERIEALVRSRIEGRDLGILGEPRVNVLLLNLALDRQFGAPSGKAALRGP